MHSSFSHSLSFSFSLCLSLTHRHSHRLAAQTDGVMPCTEQWEVTSRVLRCFLVEDGGRGEEGAREDEVPGREEGRYSRMVKSITWDAKQKTGCSYISLFFPTEKREDTRACRRPRSKRMRRDSHWHPTNYRAATWFRLFFFFWFRLEGTWQLRYSAPEHCFNHFSHQPSSRWGVENLLHLLSNTSNSSTFLYIYFCLD